MTKIEPPLEYKLRAISDVRVRASRIGLNLSNQQAEELLNQLANKIADEFVSGKSSIEPQGFIKNKCLTPFAHL